MLTLISFTSLILSTHGATKFVIDSYSVPDPNSLFGPGLSQPSPYPLDVCVSYQVTLSGITPVNSYGIYTCNQAGDEVTFTDYGTDDTCTTVDGSNSKTITYNSQLADGDLLTFNCDGESNYVQVEAYTFFADYSGQPEGGALCCGGTVPLGIATTTFATDVCIATDINGATGYTKGTCDDTGSQTLIYTDNTCTTATGDSTEDASATSCGLFTGGTISVYRLQTNCVLNGVENNPVTDYCASLPTEEPTTAEPTTPQEGTPDPTTAEPTTSEPTAVTESPTTSQPTASPTTSEPTTSEPTTAEPTAVTASPTTAEPTTAAPSEAQAPNDEAKACIFVINYVVLLVLVMAIFVN